MAQTSRGDLEALIRRAGLTISATQIEHIGEGWALMAPMLDRLRSRRHDFLEEPAHIFRADSYLTPASETDAF